MKHVPVEKIIVKKLVERVEVPVERHVPVPYPVVKHVPVEKIIVKEHVKHVPVEKIIVKKVHVPQVIVIYHFKF